MVTMAEYRRQRAESFTFDYVPLEALSPHERGVLALAPSVARLVGFVLDDVDLRISDTMRPAAVAAQEVGLWDPSDGSITIKRSQLADPRGFCGTLLHEICHATSGEADRTLEFEGALTELLGVIAARHLQPADG